MSKEGQSKKRSNRRREGASISKEPSVDKAAKSSKDRGTSDLANKYKFTYAKTYKDLPNWKKQVIDNKEYDDRIYKEFIKEVIREAEQSKTD